MCGNVAKSDNCDFLRPAFPPEGKGLRSRYSQTMIVRMERAEKFMHAAGIGLPDPR